MIKRKIEKIKIKLINNEEIFINGENIIDKFIDDYCKTNKDTDLIVLSDWEYKGEILFSNYNGEEINIPKNKILYFLVNYGD